MGVYGFLGVYGYLWVSMGLNRCLWVSMSTYRCFWVFGCLWVLYLNIKNIDNFLI